LAQPTALFEQTATGNIQVLQAYDGEVLNVPGDAWLLKADFTPQGSDLLLTGPDGSQVLILDYFNLDTPPDLMTDAGGIIPAELAIKLAGPAAPGQFALLENGPFSQLAQAAESIGRVEATDGLVEAVRIDGTTVTLTKGDDIFQGDTLVTAKGAAIGITFVDDTIFSLGEEGRMVIDEMVYDPVTQEGAFSANLVQGVFTFVSGEIAKTGIDAMMVTTPVASIGIRGTKVAGRAAQEGADNTISLLPETLPDGTQIVGQLAVSNQGGGPPIVLSSAGATMQMKSAFAALPPPVVFSPAQIQQNFGSTLTMQAATEVTKASNDAAENAEEAQEAEAQAEQAAEEAETAGAEAVAAEAEAEAAAAEAELAAGEAEALAAEAAAGGDEAIIAEAEAKAAEAEALAIEAETKAGEAEAQVAEAEAQAAEAVEAQADAETKAADAAKTDAIAERAAQDMQMQNDAFSQFGGPVPAGAEGDAPPDMEAPPDGGPEGEGGPQGEGGGGPADGEQQAGDGQPSEEGEAIADGSLDEKSLADEAGAEGPADQFGGDGPAFGGANPDGDGPAFGGDGGDKYDGDGPAFGGDGGDMYGGDGPAFGGDGGDKYGGDGGDMYGGEGNMFGGGDNIFGGGGDIFSGGDDIFSGGDDMFSGGGGDAFGGDGSAFGGDSGLFDEIAHLDFGAKDDVFGGYGGDKYGGGGDIFGGDGGDMYGGDGDIFGGSGDADFGDSFLGDAFSDEGAFDPLEAEITTMIDDYNDDYSYTSDAKEDDATTVDYETLTMTSGSGGTTYDWKNDCSNNETEISATNMGTNQYLSGTISDTAITGAADTIGIFEFTGDSLGANDIIVGTTTAATIEGWAATALSTVDHVDGDEMVFIMYDNGSATSTAAVFQFFGDSTTTGISAAELDLIAVTDVTQDSITYDNIV
jgi:hypothetical protein